MSVELRTGRYQTFEPSMGTPVAITVGSPRFKLDYNPVEMREVSPWGLLDAGSDFERLYRMRLDRLGVEKLRRRFEAIEAQYGSPLVLLCYCQGSCHRRYMARWWTEQTGEAVPELDVATLTQTRLPL